MSRGRRTENGITSTFPSLITLAILVLACGCMVFYPGTSPAVDGAVHEGTAAGTAPHVSPYTIPIETACNVSVAEFWRFTLTGPYQGQPAWTSASVDPEPAVLYDINGLPRYYEFYIRNGDQIPGYMWVAADRRVGHGVFRFYESAPVTNFSRISTEAVNQAYSKYPGSQLLSVKTGLYSGSYPHLCTIVTMLNTTSGSPGDIIVDATTNEVVPDHPSEEYTGHEYAWSYFDSIPEEEWKAKAAEWEDEYTVNAAPVIRYALSRGIAIDRPLTGEQGQAIHDFLSPESAGELAFEKPPGESLPVTDENIRKNAVTASEARVLAQAAFWRRAVDRPDIYATLSYRNATLGSGEPLIIEDINGRKMFYLFAVERDGERIHWIVTSANRLMADYLKMPAETGDLDNATRIAEEMAGAEFPGETIRSRQVVYCNDPAGSGTWVVLTTYDPNSDRKHRIAVDTWSFNATVGSVMPGQADEGFPSLFSRVEPEKAQHWIEMWDEEAEAARNFTGFASSHGISGDRVLTGDEIIVLGSWISDNIPRYAVPQELYNPLYPEAGTGTALIRDTLAWHEQADWFSEVYFDAGLTDAEIEQVIHSHPIPYRFTVWVSPFSIVNQYSLTIPIADYNATMALLEKNGNIVIPEQHTSRGEYLELVKRDHDTVTVPAAVDYPMEANALSLQQQGITLRPMKVAQINYYSPTTANRTERHAVLSELITDGRVLFAMKEYPG